MRSNPGEPGMAAGRPAGGAKTKGETKLPPMLGMPVELPEQKFRRCNHSGIAGVLLGARWSLRQASSTETEAFHTPEGTVGSLCFFAR